MESTYYMGEYLLTVTPSMAVNATYSFEYAKQTEDGWIMVLSKFNTAGYAGGGDLLEYPIKINEIIELGDKMKAYLKDPMKPKKSSKITSVRSMQITAIDAHSVTIAFDTL